MLKNDSSQSFRELSVISKISQNIISTLDFQEVLQVISDGMSELLDIESAALYTVENDTELHLGATTPPLDPGMPDFLRKALMADHPYIQRAINIRKSVELKDSKKAKLTSEEQKVMDLRHLRSLLYFPFVQKENVLGVLILGTCNKVREFTEHEIELGQTVANQLSVAIQNTRLHIDLKNHKDNLEQKVVERTHELEATNEELTTIIEELHQKNEIVNHQNKEIEATLNHLKAIQVKLIQSEKMASLGVLTAGVAHEINNPLNFIMGSYHGLELFFNEVVPEYKEEVDVLLNAIKTGVDRATNIVQGLNQFSRDSHTLKEKCDLHSIIDNCLNMLLHQYKNKIVINKNYNPTDAIVIGNAGKLHQVFINVLTNAVQSIKNKGEISIETKQNKSHVHISINDTGCGIKSENLQNITDPFFTTKSPQEGTGLGLSITYNIIQEHKGQLAFESELKKGTSVKITLPIN